MGGLGLGLKFNLFQLKHETKMGGYAASKDRGTSMNKTLHPCCVVAGHTLYWGVLYMENERVVVLLNNLAEKADLGPLQDIRRDHIEPEADIVILPRGKVDAIEIFEEFR